MTFAKFRANLLEAEGAEWCRLAEVVLKKVRPDDALVLVGLDQMERHWEKLQELLGSEVEFWDWVLDAREITWEKELPQRKRWSPLLSVFWVSQGFSTRVANALSGAGIRSWETLHAMKTKELEAVRDLGKVGIAEIRDRLEARSANAVGI